MAEAIHMACPHCGKTNRLPGERLADRPRCGSCKQGLFTGHPVTLTDATFAKFIEKTDVPVVVDFWAPWCGPCLQVAPTLEALSEEFSGQVRFVKINVDENPQQARAQLDLVNAAIDARLALARIRYASGGDDPALAR